MISSPCKTCNGKGRERRRRKLAITIPPGMEEGYQLRLSGEGEHGGNGGPPGDLYVSFKIGDHPFFRREGRNIRYLLVANVVQATLGSVVRVPTLEGEVDLSIPEGTQSGQTFRLKGKGIHHLRSKRRGDQLVTVEVRIPKTLTEDQKTLFQKLGESLEIPEDEIENGARSWFERIKDTFSTED